MTTKASKIILRLMPGSENRLEAFVEECIRDGVKFVAVTGEDAARIEDLIDELIVGDGSDASRFILTSSHPNEPLASVIRFASSLTGEYAGEVEVVEISPK